MGSRVERRSAWRGHGWKVGLGAGLVALGLTQIASGFHSDSFSSPSGDVQCRVIRDGNPLLACTSFDSGRVMTLSLRASARLTADSGQFGFSPEHGTTLAYNRTWSGHGFTCYSLVSGMQCGNPAGYGFKISRTLVAGL